MMNETPSINPSETEVILSPADRDAEFLEQLDVRDLLGPEAQALLAAGASEEH